VPSLSTDKLDHIRKEQTAKNKKNSEITYNRIKTNYKKLSYQWEIMLQQFATVVFIMSLPLN